MAFSKELTGPTNVNAAIAAAARKYGVDPNAMRAIAQIESGGNPLAKNPKSSAGGLFQFIDSTAAQYGLTDKFNLEASADAGARLARDNAASLRAVLGREPTAGELYLAHQQGAGGARRLLANPGARAVDIVGADAVRLNGGNDNMTAGEFASLWTRKADRLLGAGGDISGYGGDAALAGGSAEDDLSDIYGFLGVAPPAAPAAPEQPAPPPSPVDAYASTGALAPAPVDDLANVYQFLGVAPQAPAAPVDEAASMRRQAEAVALGLGTEYLAARGMTPEQIAAAQSQGQAAFEARPQTPGIRGTLSQGPFGAASGYLDAAGQTDNPLAKVGNVALAGLSGLAGAGNYAVGAAADVAAATGLMTPQSAKSLARDIVAMPEAFAGSPATVGARVPAAPAKAAPLAKAADAVSEIAPAAKAVDTVADAAPDVQKLLVAAQGRGGSSRKAIRELARIADIDPEAAKAAERLGIELPADVFSKSIPVREVAGAIRGVKGGDAANDFFSGVEIAQGKAKEAMNALDGGQSISAISEGVLGSLGKTRDTLKQGASQLYDAIDAKVPKATPITAPKTTAIIQETISDIGGIDLLSAQEKNLLRVLTDPKNPMTYGGMLRIKQDIGRAIERGQGPFGDVNTGTLKRLYGALADDQISAVGAVAGKADADALVAANGLTAQRKALEESMVSAFGKDLEGSIATKLTSAVERGAKGDISGLNKMLNVIPKDMQREAVAAAISDVATVNGKFGFEKFAKTYRGMRDNPPIYKKVVETLGPEAHTLMLDLYRVSESVAKAKAAIPMTGKANQITQSGALGAEGLMTRVLNTTTGRTAVRAATTAGGGIAGGIPGAIAADSVAAALTVAKPNAINAAGKLLSSDEFRALAVDAATKPTVSTAAKKRVLASASFRAFAKLHSIKNPEAWINAALLSNIAATQPQGNQE